MKITVPVLVVACALLAAPARAQESSITMFSEEGDYIGQGQSYFYTPSDGTFICRFLDNQSTVDISFENDDHFWFLDFSIRPNPLTTGSYPNATRWPFEDPGTPGLSVDGDGRGCNTLTGSFSVNELTSDGMGHLTSFAATFVQHCEGAMPALTGDARCSATAPVVQFFTIPPCRVFDTRVPPYYPAIGPTDTRIFAIGGTCGIPTKAKGAVINLTVTGSTAPGYLTVFPANQAVPMTSTINYRTGQTRTNNAVIRLDGFGNLNIYNGSIGNTHVILDVNGYFM